MATHEQVNTDSVQTLAGKTLSAPLIAGGTASGATLSNCSAAADPTTALGVATKQYVDTHVPTSGILPQGYLFGLTVSNNTGDAVNDLDIAAGVARGSQNLVDILFPTAMTKRADAAWAAGNLNGGMFTGAFAANTTYHVFVIFNPTTSAVDIGFDTNINAANRPAAFTGYRRIASLKTGAAAAWPLFQQNGRKFELASPALDFDSALTAARSLQTLGSVPTGKLFEVLLNVYVAANSIGVYITNPAMTDLAPSITIAPLATAFSAAAGIESQVRVTTSVNAQIATRAAGATQCRGSTVAYYDDFDGGVIGGGTILTAPRAGTPLVRSPMVANSSLTVAHNLGAVPDMASTVLENLTAEFNYVPGDKVLVSASDLSDTNATGNNGLSVIIDAVNVTLVISGLLYFHNKTTGAVASLTMANWKATVTPFKLV